MKTDNELIAEFMGLTKIGIHHSGSIIWGNVPGPIGHCIGEEFDISWDWLMPVVEKIGNIELPNGQYGKYIDFAISTNDGIGWIFWTKDIPGDRNQPQSYPVGGKMIHRTYKAVIDFIKWYNTQTTISNG